MSLKRWLTYSPVRVGSVLVLMIIAVLLASSLARPATHIHAAPMTAVATLGTATLTVADCPAGTVLLNSQAWFTAFAGQTGHDFGHTHLEFCYPAGRVFNGNAAVPFTFLLTMHDNPGGALTGIAIQVFGNYGAIQVAKQAFKPAYTCADTCSWLVTLTLDLTKVPKSGRQELRVRPSVTESDGAKSIISTSYPFPIASDKPKDDYRGESYWQGKGWYDTPPGIEYAKAQLLSLMPIGPISGVWTPTVGCQSSALPVTSCLVALDSNFHMGDNGVVLYQGTGAYKGTVRIDTRSLAPGWHKLIIRSDVRVASVGSTNSGLLGISFYVSQQGAVSAAGIRQ